MDMGTTVMVMATDTMDIITEREQLKLSQDMVIMGMDMVMAMDTDTMDIIMAKELLKLSQAMDIMAMDMDMVMAMANMAIMDNNASGFG